MMLSERERANGELAACSNEPVLSYQSVASISDLQKRHARICGEVAVMGPEQADHGRMVAALERSCALLARASVPHHPRLVRPPSRHRPRAAATQWAPTLPTGLPGRRFASAGRSGRVKSGT